MVETAAEQMSKVAEAVDAEQAVAEHISDGKALLSNIDQLVPELLCPA